MMVQAGSSALSRPDDFRAVFIGSPSPAITHLSRSQSLSRTDQEKDNLQLKVNGIVTDEAIRLTLEPFIRAVNDALALSVEMIAEDEIAPIDGHTLKFAIQSLAPVIAILQLPPPLMLPLQNGGIGAEWHGSGLNIELRFRRPYDVYAVLEDARNAIQEYHGRDPDLVHTRPVLSQLRARLSAH
jgi:hypothetical protein